MSVVGIATTPRAGRSGFRTPVEKREIFLFHRTSVWTPESIQPCVQCVPAVTEAGLKFSFTSIWSQDPVRAILWRHGVDRHSFTWPWCPTVFRLYSWTLQSAVLQFRSATYSNVFALKLCITVHSVSFITELGFGVVTGCQDGCRLCVRYSCGFVGGKDTLCRKGGRIYFYYILWSYSDTSANEDNSFRKHIR